MSTSWSFNSPPAALGLIVCPVVRFGLHLDVQLILVYAAGQRPLQRRQRGYRDAVGEKNTHSDFFTKNPQNFQLFTEMSVGMMQIQLLSMKVFQEIVSTCYI